MFRKIRVSLKGETPLLMNKPNMEEIRRKGGKIIQAYVDEEEARKRAYIAELGGEERLYIPMEALFSMLVYTAGAFKMGRRSARSYIAGSIRIEPEKIPLEPNEYEIDLRVVNIKGSRVVRARPRIRDWRAIFTLIYDTDTFTNPEMLRNMLVEAGKRVGLLDFRPQRNGWFGTFTVDGFEEVST